MLSRIRPALISALLTTGLTVAVAGAAAAQGFIIPRPGIVEQPFLVKSVRVNATVTDAVADTTVEQTFVNNSSVEQEGTYVFPLPEGASVSRFSLRAGDQVIEAKMLGKDEARAYYESIVRRRRDPALLEYVGTGMFRASVFPIPAHGERALTLSYQEIIRPAGGVKRYVYPLSTGRLSPRAVPVESVAVKLKTTSALKTVYSPTHDISVRRIDDHSATASWEGRDDIPDRDFTLYYSTADSDVGMSLLTYQTGDRDGYFMLIAAPRVDVPADRILPKQVVFVLDRTGSMAASNKITQAKAALTYCLDSLHPSDRFDVITFNESPDVMSRSLMAASAGNIRKAQGFVKDIEASGGTNIDEALRSALALLKKEPGRQKMVVFLTDGLPTVGETDPEKILADVKSANEGSGLASESEVIDKAAAGAHARIFTFGVGYDVNVPFLDKLAQQTRADSDYVRPTENIESIVSGFFAKVSSPILANVKLSFDGVEVRDIYPKEKEIGDLFKGDQLVITGRYRGDGPATVVLTGTAQGKSQSFALPKAFGDDAARSTLVPRIWAMRKIGYLLDQVRLHQDKEVVDEIVRLSKDYGIVTPYTSYLADDQAHSISMNGTGPNVRYEMRERLGASSDFDAITARPGAAGPAGPSGEAAAFAGMNSGGYRRAQQAPTGAQARAYDMPQIYGGAYLAPRSGGAGGGFGRLSRDRASWNYGAAQDAAKSAPKDAWASNTPSYRQVANAASVQATAGRVFYRRGNIWFDNGYKSGENVVKIQAYSDAHFQLLRAVPALNKYAAVGDEVVVQIGRNAVQIGNGGKDKLTDAELKDLTAK